MNHIARADPAQAHPHVDQQVALGGHIHGRAGEALTDQLDYDQAAQGGATSTVLEGLGPLAGPGGQIVAPALQRPEHS